MIIKLLLAAFATIIVSGFLPDIAQSTARADGESSATPHDDGLIRAAELYATYRDEVEAVTTKRPANAEQINHCLFNLGGHNPKQLSRGWIAFSALIAARNPQLQASVAQAGDYYDHDTLLAIMAGNSSYARSLNGAEGAVRQALNAAQIDSQRLFAAGEHTKKQAYSLQAQKWAAARLANPDAVAASIMRLSKTGLADERTANQTSPTLASALEQASVQPGQDEKSSQTPANKRLIADRIATLAVYHLLGQTPETNAAMSKAMNLPGTTGCFNLAILNLQQCVAAVHTLYEVPFCTGQHALSDMGNCIGNATN